MKKIIIGCPFGNYLRFAGTTPTLGTYTLAYRGGFLYRLWRVAATVRYYGRLGGWVNKLGLPNPGINSLKPSNIPAGSILSVLGFSPSEWAMLIDHADRLGAKTVELNISCPNVESYREQFDHVKIAGLRGAINIAKDRGITLIAKLPPIRWMAYACALYNIGIRHFHVFNTMYTPGGGVSGKPLTPYVLWAINDLRYEFKLSVRITAGGGVTSKEDVGAYLAAGADHVAIASTLFNPFSWVRVKSFVAHAESIPTWREAEERLHWGMANRVREEKREEGTL